MATDSHIENAQAEPLVERLLANGGDRHFGVDGHIGQAPEGRLRLYSDLTLRDYVEIARTDVIDIVKPRDAPGGRAVVFFRREAELTYVQTMSVRAEQLLTAGVSRTKPSCDCSGAAPAATYAARQAGGGLTINLCNCGPNLDTCLALSEFDGRGSFWCYMRYFWCLLTCGPVTIPV